jgi:hypothetical protein
VEPCTPPPEVTDAERAVVDALPIGADPEQPARIEVCEPGEVFPPDAYVYLVDPRRQQIVLAATGNNPGNKLSATAPNSEQLRSP